MLHQLLGLEGNRRGNGNLQTEVWKGREFKPPLLADVNSRSRSLYAIADPSVVCLSVTLVRPTQPAEIFGNFFTIR